jgi:3-isopropylmalate dehydrogenase
MLLEHFGLYEADLVHEAIESDRIPCGHNGFESWNCFGTNEVGEFVSNFILNKDDLLILTM